MRRDDREFDPSEGIDELDAIAAQWTAKWQKAGGPEANFEDIKRRDEYAALDAIVRQLPVGSRLLDGGCGMGAWTVHFTRRGYPTVGLDISKPTVAALRGLFPDIRFDICDIRKTGEPDNSFDLYFSWGTFEHFEEGFGPVVDEAFRILKPGGRLLISTPFDNLRHSSAASLARARNVSPTKNKTRFYQWRLTRGEMAQVLARGGFQVDDVRIIHKPQGTLRWLQHNVGLDPSRQVSRGLAYGLSLVLPAPVVGHMVLGLARKPLA